MERDQLRETFFNGVLGRIACGAASLLAGLSGTSTADHSNNDSRHQEVIIGIPGPRNIKVNNGKGWTKKWDASEIKTKSVFKKKKEIKTTTFDGKKGKNFDGYVMKNLWSKLLKDPPQDSSMWTMMRKELHSTCRSYMLSWWDSQTITSEKVPSEEKQVTFWEFQQLPFIIPPEDDRWKNNSIVKEPNPYVMYLFWHAIYEEKRISGKQDRKKKVRFTIDVDGTKYKFGDDDKNATEYYMKYDDQIHKK